MLISDWTSNHWVTCFSDVAENMLDKTAQEIGDIFERDKEEADAILAALHFKSFVFKLRSGIKNFGDNTRNEIIIQTATPVIHSKYNDYLIKNIKRLTKTN